MSKARRFSEMLREARQKASQSTEVMGILLNMEEEDYIALERAETYPDNETLKRLCMMLEWNYYDTQRAIINEISTRPGPPAQSGADALQALQSTPVGLARQPRGAREALGTRLREVREKTGQSVEIIGMLLGIEPEHYLQLEQGAAPGDDLLRRISMVYDWNYHDLQALLRTEQAHALQPRRSGSPFPGASPHTHRLRRMLQEMEGIFTSLPERDQQFVLAQVELIRETMLRLRHAS